MGAMDGDQTARLLYFTLFGLVIGGGLILRMRGRMGELAKAAGAWVLIFVAVVFAAGLWADIRDETAPRQSTGEGGRVEVLRGPGGGYDLVAEVNGAPVRFVVDTGASDLVLSHDDAERAGVDLDGLVYTGSARTANGAVQVAEVVLDEVRLGDVVDRGVRAAVTDGDLGQSLLGMRYLERFQRVSIEGGRLVLER